MASMPPGIVGGLFYLKGVFEHEFSKCALAPPVVCSAVCNPCNRFYDSSRICSGTECEFSYVDSVPSATVAPALWKLAGCSESLPASSAQTVLNERVGAAVDGYISSDKTAFILNHDYLAMFLQSHDELSTTHNILGWKPTESYTGGEGKYFAVPIDTSGLTYDPDSAETFVFHSAAAPEPEPTAPAQEPSTPASTADLAKIVSSENLSSVFDEVKSLLPVVCAVIVGYIGLRKGISFLQSVLQSA